jgi:antirestriction protein ArdC
MTNGETSMQTNNVNSQDKFGPAQSTKKEGVMTVSQASAAMTALENAVTRNGTMNYQAIFEGFLNIGIDAADIQPRVNIFTFKAWIALGRVVRKGESGVCVVVLIPYHEIDKDSGELKRKTRAKNTTVFHISQTDALPTKNEVSH